MSDPPSADQPPSGGVPPLVDERRNAWPGALPRPLTPLVGREQEVAAIAALLRRDDVLLVTLTGPGGVGKTRLALASATELATAFTDGVAFADLSPIRDSSLVLPAIAQALDVHEGNDVSLAEQLHTTIGGRHLLLVLDNCEQVLVAPTVAQLLSACPDVKILATSRAVLRATAEHTFPVPPLSLPRDGRDSEAVALFVARASAAEPSFALTDENAATIAEICHRLDGLPLAIELAAARLRLLPPDALLTRLTGHLTLLTGGPHDRPARQQTLRDAIAWSYDLLSPDQQTLFRHLAAFTGGFSLDAAESIIQQDEIDQASSSLTSPFDALGLLLDHSLIQRRDDTFEPRFGMLETIRAFGVEQLVKTGEEPGVRRKHATYFLQLAERAEPELTGPNQQEWFDRLEAEQPNLRAALEWTLAHDPGTAPRFAGALGRFWWTHGHLVEGRRWLTAALDQDAGTLAERAKALYAAGSLAGEQGDYAAASAYLDAALASFRQTGDRLGEALTLNDLGLIARDQGDLAASADHHRAALAIRRDADDRRGTGVSLANLGVLAMLQGDYEEAENEFTAAAATFRQLGDQRSLATAASMISDVAYRRGNFVQATRHAAEALRLLQTVGDQAAVAIALITLAGSLRAQEVPAQAIVRYEEALALFRALAHQRGIAAALSGLAAVVLDAADLNRAVPLLRECLDVLGQEGDRTLIVGALEETARAALAGGFPVPAARLIGYIATERDAVGSPRSAPLEAIHQRLEAETRAALGRAAFSATRAAGATLSIEQALSEATDALIDVAVAPPQSVPTAVAPTSPTTTVGADLTPREREVLRLLVDGRTDREIGEIIFVTTKTASNHVASILSKLGVDTRTAAAAQALRHGLA